MDFRICPHTHLIPENRRANIGFYGEARRRRWTHFTAFIQALESEFAKKQKTRKVDSADRAILIRVETNLLADSAASLDELKELAWSCGVEVFDSVIQYRDHIDPRFLLGKGKISALVIKALQIGANLLSLIMN